MSNKKDKSEAIRHPQQPTYTDEAGIVRYKDNPIIRFLLDAGPLDLNQITMLPGVTREDQIQFRQLLGTSVCGVGDMFPEMED